jgi:hypothetical protein
VKPHTYYFVEKILTLVPVFSQMKAASSCNQKLWYICLLVGAIAGYLHQL